MLKEKFAPKNFLLKSGNIRDVPLCGTHFLMFTGSLHDLHGYVKIAHHLRSSAAGSASWTTFWQPDFTQGWRRTELALHHERESSTLKNVRKFTLTSVTLFWNRENQLRLTKDPMIPIKEKKIKIKVISQKTCFYSSPNPQHISPSSTERLKKLLFFPGGRNSICKLSPPHGWPTHWEKEFPKHLSGGSFETQGFPKRLGSQVCWSIEHTR